MATGVQPQSNGLTSLSPTIDLSIVKSPTPPKSPHGKGSFQKTPPQRLTPIPRTSPSFPRLAKMPKTLPRPRLERRVERSRRTNKTANRVDRATSLEPIPPPDLIRNERVSPKTVNLSGTVPEGKETALAASGKRSRPDAVARSTRVISPIARRVDNLETEFPGEGWHEIAPTAKHLSPPLGPLNRGPNGSGIRHEASLPDHGSEEIIEASPDYAINPKPVYPRSAIRRNYEGTVILLVEVLRDGTVREVQILESSGHTILDRSALKAVRRWRFKPGTQGGEPVTMKVKVPLVFKLKSHVSG